MNNEVIARFANSYQEFPVEINVKGVERTICFSNLEQRLNEHVRKLRSMMGENVRMICTQVTTTTLTVSFPDQFPFALFFITVTPKAKEK